MPDRKKDKSKEEREKEREDFDPEEEKDYGGLPDRDLKKNLGCG